jgi:hypothetical protein
MKRLTLIIIIYSCVTTVFAQDKKNISIETDVDYFYHFMGRNTNNYFNYGISFLVSRSIDNLKISAGINYSTKNYYYNVSSQNSLDNLNKVEHKLSYVNFPILIKIRCCGNEQKKLSILSGFLFNRVIRYDKLSYFDDKPSIYEKDLSVDSPQLGLTFRFGLNFSKNINNYFRINLEPFSDYKLILNTENSSPDYENIPDNRLSLGLKVGLEYMF